MITMLCPFCAISDEDIDAMPNLHCPACHGLVNQPCPLCECPLCFSGDEKSRLKWWLETAGPLWDWDVFYHGERVKDHCLVIRRKPGWPHEELSPRFDLRTHSPDGFNWGYGGSGPAQLALALLADATTDLVALEYYQSFKRDFLEREKRKKWSIRARDIRTWLMLEADLLPP